MRRAAGLAVLVAVLIAVVFGLVGQGTPGAVPTYYRDVKPILDGRCAGCHYGGGIAPFALTSYRQAQARRVEIAQAVTRRIMPPWHADRAVRGYLHDPSLSDAQIATIRSWAAASAPAGDASAPGAPLPPVAPHLSHVDLRLAMAEPYTPRRRAGADDYRCFVLRWSPTTTTYVTGVDIRPGRRKQVHHIILYLAQPHTARTVEQWDASERSAGYGCYGGPSKTGEALPMSQLVAGWVPGLAAGDLPAGTGVEIPPGARLILQVHYNLDYVEPRPDRSTVELSHAGSVERRGIYFPLVDPAWTFAPASFAIPKGQKRIRHAYVAEPRPILRFLAPEFDVARGLEIHSALLHMHRLGVSGEIAIERASTTERLLSVPRWDFHWQREYRLAEPTLLEPGERLSIRCRHDNSAANQPVIRGKRAKPRHVTWGEDSSDEMCIGFLYATER